MKATTALCLALAATAFAGPAHAIFKCTTAKGVVYQDRPCRDGNETDVTIVVPTGEIAPRPSGTTDDARAATAPRQDEGANAPRVKRPPGDAPATTGKAPERRADPVAAVAETQQRIPTKVVEKSVPMTPEQARNADPTAKYYATEAFGPSGETPSQMNCVSPSGETRVFYLSNGKLTSI